jgi:hypothetical protein
VGAGVGSPDPMSDLFVDLRGMLRGLHESEVDYVLFGAMGMLFYGYVRNTEDLDILVNPDPENLDRVAEWLISLKATLKLNPARPFGPRERWGMRKGSNATVLTPLGQVDIVQRLPGLPEWPRLIDEAEVYEIEGMRVNVLNRQTLIDLKRRRGSNLDLADIDAIEQLAEL